jgi:N-acetylmuramic acid 6-phosphate etherase
VVSLSTGASPEDAERALAAADGIAKVAIVSLLAGVDAAGARARLDQTHGDIGAAVGR